MAFEKDESAEAEGDAGEELIGDAEDGPEGLGAALGIGNAVEEKEAPAGDDQGAAEGVGEKVGGIAEGFDEASEGVLKEVAADARSGVEGGENKERLEHEGEVVPEAEELLPESGGEEFRHADGEGGGASGTSKEAFLLNGGGELFHLIDGDLEDGSERTDFGGGGGGDGVWGVAGDFHVDGEIDPGFKGAGGDQGEDGDEGFEAHGSITDGADVAFAGDDFGGDAAADERVEAADGPAGDGDETEGE